MFLLLLIKNNLNRQFKNQIKMKRIIVTFSLLLIGFSVQSQEIKKKKNTKISFKVDGICGLCKTRIETAALKTKGVKFAIWSPQTHQINVILDERKTEVSSLQKNILKAGHDIIVSDTKKLIATKESYESVHPCCKYREEEIVLDHIKGLKKQNKNK